MSPHTRPSALVRVALLVAGTGVASFGYLVTVASGVGNGPLFAVQDGLHERYGLSLASAAVLCGLVLVAVAAALKAPLGIGTVAVPVLGGLWIAILEPAVPPIQAATFQWPAFIVGTVVMMFGAVAGLGASLGASAMDGVMLGWASRAGWAPSTTRLAMESCLAVAGAGLGGHVGAGTVVMGVMVGPLFALWTRWLGRCGLPLPAPERSDTRLMARARTSPGEQPHARRFA